MEAEATLNLQVWIPVLLGLALVRAWLIRRDKLTGLFKALGHVEVGFLGLLLATLIVLGVLQIVLRNVFSGGLVWIDPVMRHIVLWLGCLGAALATTRARHINIDVFSRLLPRRFAPVRQAVVFGATAVATFVLGLAAWGLVVDEREFGDIAFGSVPVWTLQLVLPVAFFLMSYRSLVNLFGGHQSDESEEILEGLK